MKQKFVNSSINFITKYQECDDLKLKRLKYGLEGIYNLVVKISVVILISIFTQTLIETLLFIFFYAGIRTFSFGWHANSNIACWITTILIYNVLLYFIINLNYPNYIGYIILGISLISMLLWAPADTPKRPLIRKKQRLKSKILSIIVLLLYTIIYMTINSNPLKSIILYASLVQTILINPITYKITNTRFNNYKYYKKKTE